VGINRSRDWSRASSCADLPTGRRQANGSSRGACRIALAEALEAEPFDIAAVERIIDEGRANLATLANRGTRLLIEEISSTPASDRAAYAEALRNPPHRRDRNRGERPDH
jgi:hypothetical protein